MCLHYRIVEKAWSCLEDLREQIAWVLAHCHFGQAGFAKRRLATYKDVDHIRYRLEVALLQTTDDYYDY